MFQLPSSWNLSNRLSENKTESFLTWADSTRYLSEQARADNVVRVLSFPEVSPSGSVDMIKEFDYTHNLVTNNGEIFYAKKGAGETPSTDENFQAGRFEMGTTAYTEAESDTFTNFDVSGSSKISGSRQVFTSGYPKTNDTGDSDNTGDAVDAVSYAVNYSASAWNDSNVEQGCIHDKSSPVSATKLLSVFSFTSFAKTSSDTLKVFVNHAFENQ